jgi:two-component system OmpR family response regulator
LKLSVVKKSEAESSYITTRMNAIHSCSGSCGLILIVCHLAKKQLRALKKFVIKAAGSRQTNVLYNISSDELTIIFEGMALSTTHWFGLAIKTYMKNSFSLEKNVLVASFAQAQYPNAREIGDMVRQLKVEADTGDSLIVYKAQSHLDEQDRTVLIIDDDIVAGDFLKVQLESQGYQVHQAYDGVEGISSCEELSPDVVIMELNLPALDGYQVIRNIQGNDAIDSQIIVLSEQRLEKDVTDCLNLGVTEYITKPYSPDELEQILNKVLDETIIVDVI